MFGHANIFKLFTCVRLILLKKKKDRNDVRPIGVPEPLYKILGLLWLDKTDPAAKKLLRGIQFGGISLQALKRWRVYFR